MLVFFQTGSTLQAYMPSFPINVSRSYTAKHGIKYHTCHSEANTFLTFCCISARPHTTIVSPTLAADDICPKTTASNDGTAFSIQAEARPSTVATVYPYSISAMSSTEAVTYPTPSPAHTPIYVGPSKRHSLYEATPTQLDPISAVNDHLAINIFFSICCFLPFGIVALTKSYACRKAKERGELIEARKLSIKARNWGRNTLIAGLIAIFCYSIVIIIVIKLHK